jgi:hypothetical protein
MDTHPANPESRILLQSFRYMSIFNNHVLTVLLPLQAHVGLFTPVTVGNLQRLIKQSKLFQHRVLARIMRKASNVSIGQFVNHLDLQSPRCHFDPLTRLVLMITTHPDRVWMNHYNLLGLLDMTVIPACGRFSFVLMAWSSLVVALSMLRETMTAAKTVLPVGSPEARSLGWVAEKLKPCIRPL